LIQIEMIQILDKLQRSKMARAGGRNGKSARPAAGQK
jgi:hypothetical protein